MISIWRIELYAASPNSCVTIAVGQGKYFKSEFISLQKAEKKWGIKKFSAKQFPVAGKNLRAQMAVDILKKKLFIGKSILQTVRKQLGSPDGYLFSDFIPGYEIQEKTKQNKESWQLVFIPSKKDTSKVGEVKIHKKCCYKEPKLIKDYKLF